MTRDDLRRAGEHLIALADRGAERESFSFPTGDDSEDPIAIVVEETGYKQPGMSHRWFVGEDQGSAGGRDAALFWAGYWHRDREIEAS